MPQLTRPQLDYILILKDKLHLSEAWLSGYCQARYGNEPACLNTTRASALIDEMKEWVESPAALLRAQGQPELFTLEDK